MIRLSALAWQMTVATIAWWITCTISVQISKYLIQGEDISQGGFLAWTATFEELEWLELTALQYIVGVIVSTIWLKGILAKPAWPDDVNKKHLLIAVLANVVGDIATNAAYSLGHSTDTPTRLITVGLPITSSLLLSQALYKGHEYLKPSSMIFVSLMVLSAWLCTTTVLGFSLNIWKFSAIVCSSIFIPLRNIYLKKLSDTWECPLQKYVSICIGSTLFLLPVMCVKVALTKSVFTILCNHKRNMLTVIVSLFHFACNLSSIRILQEITPVTLAILNLFKKLFETTPIIFSFNYSVGFLLFVISFVLYLLRHHMTQKALKFSSISMLVYSAVYCTFDIRNLWSQQKVYTQNFLPGSDLLTTDHLIQIELYRHRYIESPTIEITYTAWMFDRPMSHDVLMNIKALQRAVDTDLHVFCGTSQCVRSVAKLNSAKITAEFLVVPDLVKHTPLEEWVDRHPLYKVLAGERYEHHLQEAVKLAILWQYGGMYIDPIIHLDGPPFNLPERQYPWISSSLMPSQNKLSADLAISFFPKPYHSFVNALIQQFILDYQKTSSKNNSGQLQSGFDFYHTVYNVLTTFCHHQPSPNNDSCPKHVTAKFNTLNTLPKNGHHYELCLNKSLVLKESGFEVTVPGVQFFPFVDRFLERNFVDPMYMFFRGLWSNSSDTNWKLRNNLTVAFPTGYKATGRDRITNYLEREVTVGCNDNVTLQFLRNHDVNSVSMMLLTKRPRVLQRDGILIVDVEEKLKTLLPLQIQRNVTFLRQDTDRTENVYGRFNEGYQQVEMYASANVVITQSISCALSCVAIGTPVIFIIDCPYWSEVATNMDNNSELFSLFHTLDFYALSFEGSRDWLYSFPWDNPPPNPNIALMMRLRATMWNVIREKQELYDVAYKFGLVPMPPPVALSQKKQPMLFHLLFTTTGNSSIKLLGFFRDTYVSGAFNWRHLRSIESVFFHHPYAKVIIHSNTLEQSTFDVLTEAGYNIEVRRYNIEDLLKGTPAESFIQNMTEVRKGKHWYSHETDLIRLLVLYKYGGVYMDTDVVIVRPLDSLQDNVLAWQDISSVNGAFMKFERYNPFLKSCLEEYANRYNPNNWGANGPKLLTRVWKRFYRSSTSVHILPRTSFYMFGTGYAQTQCFSVTSDSLLQRNLKILDKEAYAVHLNSKVTADNSDKLKDGTLCKYLLNSFCVLCNIQY